MAPAPAIRAGRRVGEAAPGPAAIPARDGRGHGRRATRQEGSAIVVIAPRPELPPAAAPPGRPLVTLSYAQTLDGRLATLDGSSRWIGGPASLRFAHELRAAHDAIVVGVGTVLRDDPRLTVRLAPGRDPLRVVVDSALRTPPTAAVLADGAAAGTVLAVTARAPAGRRDAATALGATVLELPAGADGRVDLAALLAALRGRGVGAVMVEGGAALITALLAARLVDRLAVCVAPKILGAGLAAVGDLGIRDLDRALALRDVRAAVCGADLLLTARVDYPEGPDGGA
ncbi:MAG TPA: RibD family protein [Thermomicrobiales bacterium]|nr:RibD family protein [Thermomicrobiales bacterium]